jgi:LytTr DNA-binding domain
VAWTFSGRGIGGVDLALLANLYPDVLLAGLIVTGIQFAVRMHSEREAPGVADTKEAPPPAPAAATDPVPVPEPANPLLDRLPAAIGQDILCLENEDHYVRVHTPAGNALVLIRMRDAVAALEALDGARVHRGWWVARKAIGEVVRRDRATLLRLTDGRDVPVARSAVQMLHAKGWL